MKKDTPRLEEEPGRNSPPAGARRRGKGGRC